MKQISVTLEICTLYKGLPHGLAVINYTDPKSTYSSFHGVGIFFHGQLHNTPFTWFDGDGDGFSLTKMQDGRAADGSYRTHFYPKGHTQHVDSMETKTDVSRWQYYSGQVDKEMRGNGQGKRWEADGSIIILQFKNHCRTEGKKYELQPDKTFTLFHVKYNEDGDEIEKKQVSKGHEIV